MAATPDVPQEAPEWWKELESARLAAETEKLLAEAAAHSALAARHEEDARTAAAIADGTEIDRDKMVERRQRELADNHYHHVYSFTSSVSDSSVKAAIDRLTEWSRNDPACSIEIILNSPGGEIFAGMAFIDFVRELQAKGHHVTTVALGMAASMAGVILQVGDKRVMGANSFLLIHEASFGAFGSYGDVEDRVKLVDMMHERILKLFVERSKLSKAQIKNKWTRRDWWIPSDEALKHGLVDEVRGA